MARTLSQQTHTTISHLRVPPEAVRTALQKAGVARWYADDMAKLHGMLAQGYEDVVTDDARAFSGTSLRTLAQFAGDFARVLAGKS